MNKIPPGWDHSDCRQQAFAVMISLGEQNVEDVLIMLSHPDGSTVYPQPGIPSRAQQNDTEKYQRAYLKDSCWPAASNKL